MTSIDRVSAALLIRFALEQLSAKNGHHQFEHLCRHLARARICERILPSTGPVSKGGDQGADFETFQIPNCTTERISAFQRSFGNAHVVFACTLQKAETVSGKIRKDVKNVLTHSPNVKNIQFFTSADIPKSVRSELKIWGQEKQSVHIEIFDGQAISELLADPEIIWIAERFLEIPPKLLQGDARYREALCVTESNILDVYYFQAPLRYIIKLTNRSEVDWSDLTISSWVGIFGQNNPLVPLTLEPIFHNNFSLLPSSHTLDINLTNRLLPLVHANADLWSVLFNPYGLIRENPEVLLPSSQLEINSTVAPLPQQIEEMIVKTLIEQPTNLKLVFYPGNVRAGLLNVLVIEGYSGAGENPGKFQKIVPFVNMWATRKNVVKSPSDLFFINAPITVASEFWNGEIVASATKAIYEIQDDDALRQYITTKGGRVERPKVTVKSIDGMNVTAHTVVVLAEGGRRFFDWNLEPTGQVGQSISFEPPLA